MCLLLVNTAAYLGSRLQPCYPLVQRHFLLPALLKRHALVGPWTRAQTTATLFYLAANVFCCTYRATANDIGSRAGNLALINIIASYFGFHFSFLCNILNTSLSTYRNFHASTARTSFLLGLVHIVSTTVRSSFDIRNSQDLSGLIVGYRSTIFTPPLTLTGHLFDGCTFYLTLALVLGTLPMV